MKRAFPLLLALLGAPACQTCPPEAQALLLVQDFREPVSTVRTFLAAFACDDATVEYRCLSEALKREYGATLDAYILARQELRAKLGPAAGFAFRLELVASEEAEGGQVLQWWGTSGRPRVGFLLEPQHYFDLFSGDGRRSGAFLEEPPGRYLELEGRRLRLELENAALRGLRPATITRFELGSEWKIRDVLPEPEDPQPSIQP